MANSRELVECIADATGESLSKVTGYMRELREANEDLVKVGGRGPMAPKMTSSDAASLLCAIYGCPSVQGSARTLLDLKKLPSIHQGRRAGRRHYRGYTRFGPAFTLELERGHNVVDGLAAAIDLFGREDEIPGYGNQHARDAHLFARFEIHSPELFASMTVGIRSEFSDIWTYGRRGQLDSRKIQQCSEVTLRKIAAFLKTP